MFCGTCAAGPLAYTDRPTCYPDGAVTMAASDPYAFLASLGTDSVGHVKQRGVDGTLEEGSFMEHLVGTEAVLRGWGCAEYLCRAGLFHSIYGTESFQAFSLPLDAPNRAVVRELVGAEAERLALVNCVMERGTLDAAALGYREGEIHRVDPKFAS